MGKDSTMYGTTHSYLVQLDQQSSLDHHGKGNKEKGKGVGKGKGKGWNNQWQSPAQGKEG